MPVAEHVRTEMLAEHRALRDEINLRIRMRDQDAAASLLLLGALLTFARDEPLVLLAHPVVALFLSIRWGVNNARIGMLGWYIKQFIEKELSGLRYESTFSDVNWPGYLSNRWAAAGIFVGAGLVAVVTGAAKQIAGSGFTWSVAALLLVDAAALILTALAIQNCHASFKLPDRPSTQPNGAPFDRCDTPVASLPPSQIPAAGEFLAEKTAG